MTYHEKPKTVGELRRRTEAYFNSRLQPLLDKNGLPITDENGEIIKKLTLPYTLTGLALALGCESREELFTFDDPKMNRYIRMSVMKIEEYAEERLFSKEAFSGVKLFLSVNFERWRDGDQCDDGEYELPDSVGRWTV